MRQSLILILLITVQLAGAKEPIARVNPETEVSQNHAPVAWLGLKVAKPDATITAHVPALPPGVGFLIKSVDAGGPAEAGGVRVLDLIWKIGDQMLINEAQLATLLRLAKPSEEIILSGFRGGQPVELKVTLGEAPLLSPPFPSDLVETAILTGESGGPMRIVNVAEKSATFSAEDGTAVVQCDGEIYHVTIHGLDEKVIYKGEFASQEDFSKAPEAWQRRLGALRRGLDKTLEGGIVTPRQPRPRVVPPSVVAP